MNVLGRGTPTPGVTALAELARGSDPWLARTATMALAGSGAPRARAFLREAARATDLPDGVRSAALRGLGRSYATAPDLDCFGRSTRRLPPRRSALAEMVGGKG